MDAIKAAELIHKAYIRGLKDGVTRYAWWRDGEQYVGTTGSTLKKALKQIDEEDKSTNPLR